MKFNKLDDLDTFRWERIKGAELEGKYVIASREEMYRVWFGEDAPTPISKENGYGK